jgi:4-hydroxy-tetrahydrodipicolinate reductase
MKIALIGYGKMGHEIEKAALERGYTVPLKIDIDNQHEFTAEKLLENDVAIEFTSPHSAIGNIRKCLHIGIPLVTGSTGWHESIDEMISLCKEKNGSFFYASNYSPGVNIMFAVNEFLAKIMNSFPQYDVKITETHHTQKLDSPSGTAISLAEQILKNLERKKHWELEENAAANDISIKAIRKDDIKGSHEVMYDSEIDYISLCHHAKSRIGFAIGAVMAAEYLKGKKGVYTMKDLLGLKIF